MRIRVRRRRHEFIDSGYCRSCGQRVIGGKGDYWHTASPFGGYDMQGPDGHLAWPLQVGQRLALDEMPQDPAPVPVGTHGTVTSIAVFADHIVIGMDWDNGSTLSLITPPDRWHGLIPGVP